MYSDFIRDFLRVFKNMISSYFLLGLDFRILLFIASQTCYKVYVSVCLSVCFNCQS